MQATEQRLRTSLNEGLQQLKLNLTAVAEDKLLNYLKLLDHWNGAFNLTAVQDPQEMIYRHLLDSLAVGPHLTGQRFIDVGTGAGLPGIPLAIMFPDREWYLLDSNGKKTRFLFQVKTALSLDNITICHHRVEHFQPEQLFDGVLSRAFASLLAMVHGCSHLLSANGFFLAMKGRWPERELEDIEGLASLVASHSLEVPFLGEQRHLLLLAAQHPNRDTP